jgi:hypothetical protein
MTKPNDPRERTIYDLVLLDSCSFLGLGKGDDSRILSPYASVALVGTEDDDATSILADDTNIISDNSTNLHNHPALNSKYERKPGDNNEKVMGSMLTISLVNMEEVRVAQNDINIEGDDEDLPSRMSLVSEKYLSLDGTTPFDEEESITLNPLSIRRIPSFPPPLDRTRQEPEVIEIPKSLKNKLQADAGKLLSNPTNSISQILQDIDRVPLFVDLSSDDDRSMVSAISIELGDSKETNTNVADESKPIAKRLFGGKPKIPRPWRWNKKRVDRAEEGDATARFRLPFIPVARTKGTSNPSPEVFRPVQLPMPSGGVAPAEGQQKPSAAVHKYSVPAITPTKSNDDTAETLSLNEDGYFYQYGDNVPFDEPHAYSPRLMTIEQIRTGQ